MIAERIERRFFKDMALGVIHYVQPVGYRSADGLVAQVYDQML